MGISEKIYDELTAEDKKHLHNVTAVCNRLGWGTIIYDDYVSVQNHSPLGEDISFEISVDTPASDIYMEYEDFDVNWHVEMLIESRGKNGVPDDIKALYEDAEEIEKMLYELYLETDKVTYWGVNYAE